MSELRDERRRDERSDDQPYDGQREDVGVVLHEERLRAGVERVEAGRVEVRKRIVTQEVTVKIPVRREVVDVVRVYDDGSEEPMDVPASEWKPQVEFLDAGAATQGTPGTLGQGAQTHRKSASKDDVYDVQRAEKDARATGEDGSQDIVLYEERPVVSTQLFAVERLHLDLTGEQQIVPVTAEVQREVVEIDGVESVDERDTDELGGISQV